MSAREESYEEYLSKFYFVVVLRKRWSKRVNAKVIRLYYEDTSKSAWSP